MRFSNGLYSQSLSNWDQEIDRGIRSSVSMRVASSVIIEKGFYVAAALFREKLNLEPDAVSYAGNIDLIPYAGLDYTPIGCLVMLGGNVRGQSRLYFDWDFAVGIDIGASLVQTNYYYLGDINRMTINLFEGNRYSISGGYSFGIEVGGGISLAPLSNGDYILGISKHIGVSPPHVIPVLAGLYHARASG